MTTQEKIFKLFEATQAAEYEGRRMRVTPEEVEALANNRAWMLIRMNAATVLRVAYSELEAPDCSQDRAQYIRACIRFNRWILEGATSDLIPVSEDADTQAPGSDANDLEELVKSILEG